MAVPYKAPVKDIVFGYEVIDSYNVLNKISAFSDFSEDIVIPTMEECAKFSEEVLAPINAIGDQQGATIKDCLLYTSPSPRDLSTSRMPSSA